MVKVPSIYQSINNQLSAGYKLDYWPVISSYMLGQQSYVYRSTWLMIDAQVVIGDNRTVDSQL